MTIQEIKARLSIEQVLRHYGITINRNGHIQCPFHDDKKASMKVYLETNTAFCFAGSCPTHEHSVDVIDFIMHMEKCSKHEAILKAKDLAGGMPAMPKKVASKTAVKTEIKTTTGLTLNDVFASMQNGFSRTKKAQEYAAKRGLNFLNLELGYSSGQLHYGKEQAFIEDLQALQILKPLERGYLTFGKGCIIFPLKDSDGRICSLYGRKIDKNGHYYLTGRSGLYPNYPAAGTKKLLLVESIIDAATLLQIKSITDQYSILALYGTNGLTAEHQAAIEKLEQLESISIMLDGDEAGRKAASKIKSNLEDFLSSIEVKIIELPTDTDVNELWVNHQSEDLFLDLLNQSTNQQPSDFEEEKPKAKKVAKLNTENPYNWTWQGSLGEHSIKGGIDFKHWESLKVTWVLELEGGLKSRQKVDLYDDRQVEKACDLAARKLRLEALAIELELNKLTGLLEEHRQKFAKAKAAKSEVQTDFGLSTYSRKEATSFLTAPNLLNRLNDLVGATGIVGERESRLLLLLIASSYKNARPLHALIQGSSGSGKTLLLRKILKLIPAMDGFLWSRVTESSLYNWGDKLRHKLVGIEDWDGLKDEAQYALRELQSGGVLSSSTSEKQENGKIEACERITSGPIASLMCTTKGSVYEDNMSRCFLVAVDESRAQTDRIIKYQNQMAAGFLERSEELKNQQLIQNMLRILAPKEVVNPFASKVQLPPRAHKLRRLNQLYQDFVRQVVWWHQLQREQDEKGRLIAQPSDLQQAAELMFDSIVLKVDELDGSLRQFFERLKDYVLKQDGGEDYRFGQREIRMALRASKSSAQRYFKDLMDLEYLRMVGSSAVKGYRYQIVFWDDYEQLRADIKAHLINQITDLQ
jgi:DNA primase